MILAGQLTALAVAKNAGAISAGALQVYFGCQLMVASRLATMQTQGTRRFKPRYTLGELHRRVGGNLSKESIQKALKELEQAKLVAFRKTAIRFGRPTSAASQAIAEGLNTHLRRPIPIPRYVLRHLAKHTKPAETLAAMAHLIRLLFKKGKAITIQGLAKADQIAALMGISPRSVHSARKWLTDINVLVAVKVKQQVLNRHGACFMVNPFHSEAKRDKGVPSGKFAPPIKQGSTSSYIYQKVHNPSPNGPGLLPYANATEIVSLTETPVEPCGPLPGACGNNPAISDNANPPPMAATVPVCSVSLGGSKTPVCSVSAVQNPAPVDRVPALRDDAKPVQAVAASEPQITNIVPEDLKNMGRLEGLYRQAVKRRWFTDCEASIRNFVSASVRATEVSGNAVKIFVGLAKKNLWHHITQAQEERAMTLLKRYQENDSEAFRPQAAVMSGVTTKKPEAEPREVALKDRTAKALVEEPVRPERYVLKGTRWVHPVSGRPISQFIPEPSPPGKNQGGVRTPGIFEGNSILGDQTVSAGAKSDDDEEARCARVRAMCQKLYDHLDEINAKRATEEAERATKKELTAWGAAYPLRESQRVPGKQKAPSSEVTGINSAPAGASVDELLKTTSAKLGAYKDNTRGIRPERLIVKGNVLVHPITGKVMGEVVRRTAESDEALRHQLSKTDDPAVRELMAKLAIRRQFEANQVY